MRRCDVDEPENPISTVFVDFGAMSVARKRSHFSGKLPQLSHRKARTLEIAEFTCTSRKKYIERGNVFDEK